MLLQHITEPDKTTTNQKPEVGLHAVGGTGALSFEPRPYR